MIRVVISLRFALHSGVIKGEIMQIFVDADAVDYKLISICHKGDIVVSQDYGVAAMALGKGLTRSSGPWL